MDLSTASHSSLELVEEVSHGQGILALESAAPTDEKNNGKVLAAEVTFPCSKCSSTFETQDNLQEHMQLHMEERRPERLTIENTVQNPKRNDDSNKFKEATKPLPVETFTCPFCKLHFKDEETLKLHIQNIHFNNHKNGNEIEVIAREDCFKCDVCTFAGTEQELKTHLSRNHVKCNICYVVLVDQTMLAQTTKKIHTNFSPVKYVLKLLNTSLHYRSTLIKHIHSIHVKLVNCILKVKKPFKVM